MDTMSMTEWERAGLTKEEWEAGMEWWSECSNENWERFLADGGDMDRHEWPDETETEDNDTHGGNWGHFGS